MEYGALLMRDDTGGEIGFDILYAYNSTINKFVNYGSLTEKLFNVRKKVTIIKINSKWIKVS